MPYKSRWTLDIPDCTVPTFIFGSPTAALPDKPAYIDAERPEQVFFTYETYRLWSKRIAAGLRAKGFKDGDVLLVFSGNTVFFPILLMGVIMAGGIFSGANPSYTAREVAYQLQNSGAKFLVCADSAMETGLQGAKDAGLSKDQVFVFDAGYDTFEGKGQGANGCKHWSALIASEQEGQKFEWAEGKDLTNKTCALNYSSGTTGLPKGVEICHKNYVANARQHMYLTELKADFEQKKNDMRWLCFLPMYHAMAQTLYAIGAPFLRFPVYIMRKFEFEKVLQSVEKFRITELQLVPPVVVAMAKSPLTKKYDMSSVEGAGSGAAPLGREITIEFEKLWPNGQVNLKQGYGMTEVTCSVLGWDPKQHCEDFSVGEPNANTEVMLVDPESGKEVTKRYERGEIWAKGPNIMKGYWKNEKATKETLMPDGWLRTGDVAYVDDQDHFFVVDRIKELIKVKGMQVAPAELEAQLLEHPGIADVAVIGVTIDGDENPRAYIQANPDKKPTEKEIVDWMANKVAKHKQLTGGVAFVEAIEKNPSGKILRKNYRERAAKELGDAKAKL